jgi:tetratricopeptide (TPR) repeat protein
MNKFLKKFFSTHLFLTLILNSTSIFADANDYNSVMKLISIQHQYEQQGKLHVEQGKYEEAIENFDKAIELDVKINGGDRGRPMAFKIKALSYKGNYQAALTLMNYLISAHPKHEHYKDWKEELEMLSIQNLEERNKKIYGYIDRLKEKYSERLPPRGYWAYLEIPAILRLYDTIGDNDAGIKFIDEILAYFRTGKAGDPKPGKVDAEYMKIREAFEKDKSEGTKGRATKALIQSDYFPW